MQRQVRADLGAADLLLLLERDNGLSRVEVCRLLGYPVPVNKTDSAGVKASVGKGSETPHAGTDAETRTSPPALTIGGYRPRFWQVLSLQPRVSAEQTIEPTASDEQTIGPSLLPHTRLREQRPLPSPALLSQKVLWTRASRAALCAAHARRQELQQWLSKLSRAEVPSRPAREQEDQESGEIWLILDYHPRLMLWWDELNRVSAILHQRFGKNRARLIPLLDRDLSELGPEAPLPWPGSETRLLVFSDLGLLSGTQPRQQWQAVLERWNQGGVQFSVFMPHSRPPQSMRRLANERLELWDRSTREPHRAQQVVDDLLACLAMVQWCSPALLRCWRRLLKGRVEHEYRVWHHPQVWHQPGACGLLNGIEPARKRFTAFEQDQKQALLQIKDRYRIGLSREVILEEAMIQQSMGIAVETVLQQETERMTQQLQSRSRLPRATQEWLWRLSERQDGYFWKAHPKLERLCLESRRQLGRSTTPSLGPGMQLHRQPLEGAGRSLSVQVVGERLRLVRVEPTPSSPALELLRIEAGSDEIECDLVTPGQATGFPGRIWRAGDRLPIRSGHFSHLELVSDRQIGRLRQVEKPDWANAIEQGSDGLYATLPDGRRLRWCYPEEQKPRESHPLTATPGTERAAWVCERQWSGELEDWPSDVNSVMPEGVDRYGRYRDLGIGKQTLRLRWIPPGEFQMGSPEDEPERGNDERRHRVILTRGFWLADTACTQGLWREVMGKNPSRFQGDDLPVEQVSWDDVQEFLTRLNQSQPLLQARLPSEAEWEYACRARSHTPFWWGSELTTDLANYKGDQPYNHSRMGIFREITMPVKSFAPNPWGLYQMHGNVYEWCLNGYRYSSEETCIDPIEPESDSVRMRRGGGWRVNGAWLRASARSRFKAYDNSPHLGFRLAADPVRTDSQQVK
jgi:formylglycine-generating enzyme required for sulfatase activity